MAEIAIRGGSLKECVGGGGAMVSKLWGPTALLLALPLGTLAQECLFDADGDGHPLFSNPAVRGDVERFEGRFYFAWVLACDFGDFDGDGRIDLVFVSSFDHASNPGESRHYLNVVKGNGDGVFGPSLQVIPATAGPADVCVADLNQDGHPDLVTADWLAGTVSTYQNVGNGTFASGVSYAAGPRPRSVATGDFDRDGNPDVVALNIPPDLWDGEISVFRGLGNGLLAPEQRIFVGLVSGARDADKGGPQITVADVHGDGADDVLVPGGWQAVRLVVNDGTGQLSLSGVTLPVPGINDYIYQIHVRDLDSDQTPDVIVQQWGGMLSVFRGLGDLSFEPRRAYEIQPLYPNFLTHTYTVAIGDPERDGNLDAVVGIYHADAGVAWLPGSPGGVFGPRRPVAFSYMPSHVHFRDVNGDGRDDLGVMATLAWRHNLVTCLAGPGPLETYATYSPTYLPTTLKDVIAADLDGDGDVDLAAGDGHGSSPFQVRLFSNAEGALAEVPGIPIQRSGGNSGLRVASGDLNADGLPDLLVSDSTAGSTMSGRVHVVLNSGNMQFQQPVAYSMMGVYPTSGAIGDIDGDGDNDALAWCSELNPGTNDPIQARVYVWRNTGTGLLVEAGYSVVGTLPRGLGSLALGDMNGDGALDFAATYFSANSPGSGIVAVHRNIGQGVFQQVQSFPARGAFGVAIADVDRDGDSDLLALSGPGSAVDEVPTLFRFRNEDGQLMPLPGLAMPDRAQGQLALADLNGDGRPDVLTVAHHSLAVTLNRGGMEFGRSVQYGTLDFPGPPVAADFDGDGRLDLATHGWFEQVLILRNRSCAALPCYSNCDGSPGPDPLTVADFACFLQRYLERDFYANCDNSTQQPVLNVQDFTCFLQRFAAGCP